MPQVKQVSHGSKKIAIAAGAAIAGIVLVVAVVWGLVWWLRGDNVGTEAALNQAAEKSFNGDHQATIDLLTKQLSSAENDDERVQLYMALGSAYSSKGEDKKALEVFQKAAALRPGYSTNDAIAQMAEAVGDKAMALDYYQRNRQLIKDGKAGPQAGELPLVEEKIKALGGTL